MGDNSYVYSNTNFTYSTTPYYITTNNTTSNWDVYNAPLSDEEWRILEALTAQQTTGYFQNYEEIYEHTHHSGLKNRCFDKGKKIKPLQLSYNDLMQFS